MKGLAIAAALLTAAPAFSDAWPRGAGAVYLYSGVARTSATEAFDPAGKRIPFPGRGGSQRRASLYVESGITETMTLVANVPYQRVTARGFFNDFTTSGLGDLDLRLRRSAPLRAGWVAVEAGAMIPLGYDRTDFPQLGSGRTEPIVNFAYGTAIRALPEGFFSAQAGYRWRDREIGDEIPWLAKLGAFPQSKIGIFAFARGWRSRSDFGNAETTYALTTSSSEERAPARNSTFGRRAASMSTPCGRGRSPV
jgi:hypothetical protein